MRIRKDLLAVPLSWHEKADSDFFTLKWIPYNYPECFQHKEYPLCLACDTKFVPIDKGDIWCFKCKLTK